VILTRRLDSGARSALLLVALLAPALPTPSGIALGEVGPVRINGEVEGLGVLRFDAASPEQLPGVRVDLSATQRLTSGLRWKLSGIARWGGPPMDVSGPGAFGWSQTFQNISPSLEAGEAYIEIRTSAVDLRVGNQKFSWGVLDGIPPNDQLNPFEFEDPLLTNERRRKIAVPALSIDWYPPTAWQDLLPEQSRISLVWQPIAVPWRYPLLDERWFAPAARAQPSLELSQQQFPICPCSVMIDQAATNASPPARRFDNGNVGLRMSGRIEDARVSLMLFDGFDPTPSFEVPIRVRELDDTDASPTRAFLADTELKPAYVRYTSLGGDASFSIADWSVRAEVAFKFGRPYSFELSQLTEQITSDPEEIAALVSGIEKTYPAFVKRDSFEWGIGTDTFFGDFMPLVQIEQLILMNNDARLLVRNVDTRLSSTLKDEWFDQKVLPELLLLWGIESGYFLLRPQVGYAWSDWLELEVGILAIWGDRNSLIGQFRDNDEAYARVRYIF
jgi:hypothetical protein